MGPVSGLASGSPTDQTLGIAAQQRISASLRDWLVTLGALLPFRIAAEQLATLTVSPSAWRRRARSPRPPGRSWTSGSRRRPPSWNGPRRRPRGGGARELVAETDGVMVRYQDGWMR